MNLNLVSLPDITALYTALFLLLMLALAANVVRWRLKAKVSLGDGGNKDLARAMRCHGNATEYVPLVLLGMALLEMLGTSNMAMHLYGGLFLLARLAHPLGISQPKKVNVLRQLGIVISWGVMLSVAIHLLIRVI
ncbi:MAG: MAPEG family protein [Alcanivoracaceae bacterium]|nr:MAPEG family protein [Alcanivoracaceae bacterium]